MSIGLVLNGVSIGPVLKENLTVDIDISAPRRAAKAMVLLSLLGRLEEEAEPPARFGWMEEEA